MEHRSWPFQPLQGGRISASGWRNENSSGIFDQRLHSKRREVLVTSFSPRSDFSDQDRPKGNRGHFKHRSSMQIAFLDAINKLLFKGRGARQPDVSRVRACPEDRAVRRAF